MYSIYSGNYLHCIKLSKEVANIVSPERDIENYLKVKKKLNYRNAMLESGIGKQDTIPLFRSNIRLTEIENVKANIPVSERDVFLDLLVNLWVNHKILLQPSIHRA